MNAFLWSITSSTAKLGLVRPTAEEVGLLILLGVYLLQLRANHDRYFRLWTLGWAAFVISRLTGHSLAAVIPAPFDLATVQIAFIVGAGLLAGSVLLYAQWQDLMMPLMVITPILAGFAGARVLLWPESMPLRMTLEISYRLVLWVASVALLRARRGRWDSASWLLSFCLPFVQLYWHPYTDYVPRSAYLVAEVALGLCMQMVVLNESRIRASRLRVMRVIARNVAGAKLAGSELTGSELTENLVQCALDELRELSHLRAAWFRSLQDGQLTLTHAIGLSQEFAHENRSLQPPENLAQMWNDSTPQVLASNGTLEAPAHLRAEHIRQVVVVPVLGNRSPVGVLLLGLSRSRRWTTDELGFLRDCAKQLAVTLENACLREQVLRSQRQWINTFDSVPDIILAHDAEFRILKANQVLLEQLGRSAADVLGNTCESVLPQGSGKWTGCPYCQAGGSKEFTEGADQCFGGFSIVSTSSYAEQGNPQHGTIHVVRDITDRRSAEEKYRLLFEQVQEGVYITDADGHLIDCNDAFMRMLGYTQREELLARNFDTELCVDAGQREAFRQALENHSYVRNYDMTLRCKDGTLLLGLISSFATHGADGHIHRCHGFVLDMTEKRRAQDEMQRRNRELNALNTVAVVAAQSFDLDEILNLTLRQVVTLFGAESGTVYLSDTDGPIYRRRAFWGPRGCSETRKPEISFADGFGDLVMRSRAEVVSAEYMPHLPPEAADFLRSESERSWLWVLFWGKDAPVGIMGLCSRAGHQYSASDESLLVAISRQLATTIEKVRLYEETCRAYEDLRKTQEQLLQSEKMSAVGQLIAGVAHELNNPLTAILGYAQLLESEGLNERAQGYVGKLFKQAQRTHRIVQNLLSFSRQRKPERGEVDIRRIVDETLALRDYDLKTNSIRLEKDIPAEPAIVVADAHQLEQVFLNIINNAIDAILENGRKGRLRIRIIGQNGFVCTQFADDGPGIKDPKRIFDPFYTTKGVGKGTGLGLSICYGIVKEHGGDITAANNPEGGAMIEVRLPLVAGATLKEAATPAPRHHNEVLRGHVLLVEEEEAVLEFERDVLAGAGATVVTAQTSEEAKTRLLSEPFDAIIMNGKMPGQWHARESYGWLKESCPALERHVLFTFSNGVDPGDGRAFLQENSVPYLVKPFEVADLIVHTRKLLEKAQAATVGSN